MTDPSQLLAAAVAARGGAYAPYSKFPVGAALLDAAGRLWTGANVENASYGLSMCAERNAVFAAVAAGARAFTAVAVAGPHGITTTPCGACRQVLNEFGPTMRVIYADHAAGSELVTVSLEELLPGAFGPANLTAERTDDPHRSKAQPSRETDSSYRSGAQRSRGTNI